MSATKGKTEVRVIAKYVGHAGVQRVLTRKNQDALIGSEGVATEDLVWAPGNRKLDVTGAQDAVLDYLRSDEKFSVEEIEVPVPAAEPAKQ